jgi:hypothetical protein
MAASFLTVLHWDQARALFGLGDETPCFRPELKRRPLPPAHLGGLAMAIGTFMVLPYGEEIWRCLRAQRSLSVTASSPSSPTPERVQAFCLVASSSDCRASDAAWMTKLAATVRVARG